MYILAQQLKAMLKPFRFLLALTRVFLLIIPMAILIVLYVILTKLSFQHTHERAFRLRRTYLRYCNFVLGIKTEVKSRPSMTNALYVSNHRSLSDPLILCQYLDAYIIAKAEVGKYPLISTGAELTGILYVQRNDKNSRQAVREKMKETLVNKHNVLVYPEGTVNYNKHTLPYRPGTFVETLKMGIPVVPVCLEYKSWKDVWCNRGMFEHFFLQFGHWRTHVRLVIGEAMYAETGEELCQKVENWTNETIDAIHSDWNSYFHSHSSIQQ